MDLVTTNDDWLNIPNHYPLLQCMNHLRLYSKLAQLILTDTLIIGLIMICFNIFN